MKGWSNEILIALILISLTTLLLIVIRKRKQKDRNVIFNLQGLVIEDNLNINFHEIGIKCVECSECKSVNNSCCANCSAKQQYSSIEKHCQHQGHHHHKHNHYHSHSNNFQMELVFIPLLVVMILVWGTKKLINIPFIKK